MSTASAAVGGPLDISALWKRQAEALQQAEATEGCVDVLLAYLHGQHLDLDRQAALQSLSPAARSILAVSAAPQLSSDAERLIRSELATLSASSQVRVDAVDALARISGVYSRWQACLHHLGSGSSSSLPSWLRVAVEGLGDVIQSSIYDDLLGFQASNAFQNAMQGLGMSDRWSIYANRAAEALVMDRVSLVEHETDDFDEAALPKLQHWLQSSLMTTLRRWQLDHLDDIESRLGYELSVQLGHIRSRQLFDIIKEYPTSTPALTDLNVCGEECNLQPHISRHLSQSLQARLLHPGASTRDIIQFYTHLIRALRFINPSGVILSHVIGPVRTYLRARSDTISVIVASLLGQAGDFTLLRDMMRETGDGQGLGGADTSLAIYEEEDDGSGQTVAMNMMTSNEATRMVVLPSADEEDWTPRPIDAGPDYRQSRKSDVIAIIVSIFDDEEGFVAALEKSCAQQLIKVQAYDTGREYETNENLKKRFGDASLSRCDVMLNDIKKSQRYDRSIQSRAAAGEADKEAAFRALHPFILSRQFWPPMKEAAPAPAQSASSLMFGAAPTMGSAVAGGGRDALLSGKSVKMPGQFARALEQYQAAFKKMAPMQRLRWFNARSAVLLEVEMDDGRRIKESVSPLQAAVVEVAAQSKASRQDPLLVSTLVAQLEVDKDSVMEALFFWAGRGILRAIDADSTSFEVVEHATARADE